ncbi:MAG: large-conductance mechanosensitive channel protein MscL [Bacteroidetes bacterium]|nr:large-conductance mechanosensitive channel protein MscL [Bacteroidota bacterium]
MFKEFKDFIMKGNVLDLAVAVIIAGAFGLIVKSFIGDVLMPPIGLALGGVDFADLAYTLKEAVMDVDGNVTAEAVAIRWGAFVNTLINFLIVGFVIFMIVRAYNNTQKEEEPAPEEPAGPSTEDLLGEIRDLLKKG